ncbi:MAG: signal recognition particle protein [bacterium]
MFETLSEKLQDVIKNAQGAKTLNEDNIQEALREVRRALLEADVSLRVVKALISNIKDKALGEDVLKSLSPGDQLVKVVYDELTALMGGEHKPLSTEGNPNIIMMLGLQGSGKTTTAAKLAVRLRKSGRNPLLIAADVYRPAAVAQLISLGKQVSVPVYSIDDSKDVRNIVTTGLNFAKEHGHNTVIIDTAGRLQVDTDMMAEILLLDRMLEPAEKLLVIDAMTGQESVHVAESFNEQIGVTGIVLTKLDGDARGGAALSVAHVTGKPVKFAGMGEKMDALEPFYPERMAQRILGMGDVLSLIEKAQENFDVDQAKEMEKKMRKKEFSIEDFMKLQKQMKALGSLDQILGMLPIPGISKGDKEQLAVAGETQMKRIESMVNSMTIKERQKPEIIDFSRRKRIANGCGVTVEELNKFLKEFENMKKMMKKMTEMTDSFKKNPGKMKLPPGFKNQFKNQFPPKF